MKTIKDCLDFVLVDDATEYGGVAYHGETLRGFCLECNESVEDFLNENGFNLDDDISVLDGVLIECGIEPIK